MQFLRGARALTSSSVSGELGMPSAAEAVAGETEVVVQVLAFRCREAQILSVVLVGVFVRCFLWLFLEHTADEDAEYELQEEAAAVAAAACMTVNDGAVDSAVAHYKEQEPPQQQNEEEEERNQMHSSLSTDDVVTVTVSPSTKEANAAAGESVVVLSA